MHVTKEEGLGIGPRSEVHLWNEGGRLELGQTSSARLQGRRICIISALLVGKKGAPIVKRARDYVCMIICIGILIKIQLTDSTED